MSVAHFEHAGPWTFDDLEKLPDDGWRYEVVDGALLMTPPPTDFHQAVGRRLFRQLDRQAPADWEPVAAAGVAFFWRVETEPTVEIVAYELVDGQYREVARLSEEDGVLPGPYPMRIDVAALSQP